MVSDRIAPIALTLLLAASLAGCTGHGTAETDRTPAVAVEFVRTGASGTGMLTLPARVKALEEATLTARAAGRVTAFTVREGQGVAAGAALVRFDAPEARQALAAARSEEASARTAASFAARQHARMESLYTAGVVAVAEREDAEARHDAANSRLAQASSVREAAESATEVRAPFAAVVVRRHVDAGADVQPGQPLLDLRSPSGIEIVAEVPEAAADALQRVRAWVQSGEGAWREARLVSAEGMVDPTTRSLTARFAPLDRAGLEPGAFAHVRLEAPGLAAETAPITVPITSIVRRGALTGVFVRDGERVWLRWVRLGRLEGASVEVLSGLASGEEVAVSPSGLVDGTRVRGAR